MSASDLLTDASTVLRTLASPEAAFAAVADRRRAGTALLVATAMALVAAAVTVPCTDYGPGQPAAEARDDGQPAPEPTEYEREQSAAAARKVGELVDWARALVVPSLSAVAAALVLTLGFRVAGAQVAFQPALAVAAHGMLPIWLARLLAVPAALVHAPVPASEVPRLLPSSPAALLPPDAPAALLGALGGLDLFSLWAVWLVSLGMARLAGTTRTRALVVTAVLYAAYVAVFQVAAPSLLAASPGAPVPAR